jgi:hypothetical protein
MVRSTLVIMGLSASLALGLPGCSSLSDEGSSEPIGEEMDEGDDRDMAPDHQEKMRERTGGLAGPTYASS